VCVCVCVYVSQIAEGLKDLLDSFDRLHLPSRISNSFRNPLKYHDGDDEADNFDVCKMLSRFTI